jgi:uncharacterized protein (TIGR03067 family)
MGRCVVLVLALGVGTSFGAVPNKPPKGDAAGKELPQFQGEWVVVYMERNGVFLSQDDLKPLLATFRGNKFAWRFEPTRPYTITIDPTKKPRQINATAKDPNGKQVKTIGIYEFDGDKLKICDTPAGGKRPKEFTSKGGTKGKHLTLTVFKRVKKDK